MIVKSEKFEEMMRKRGQIDFATCQDQYFNPSTQLAWEMFCEGYAYRDEVEQLNYGTLDQLAERFPEDFGLSDK